MEQACRQLKIWQQDFPEQQLFVSVNVSAVQLAEELWPRP